MESRRKTPLGFIAGELETHSHCMYTYTKRDETFVRCVAEFLLAGVRVGEMAVCVSDRECNGQIRARLEGMGARPSIDDKQIVFMAAEDIYTRSSVFDAAALAECWAEEVHPHAHRFIGIRAFGDSEPLVSSRVSQLKLLEFEAMFSVGPTLTIALCGYRTGTISRSFMTQVRDLHPFLATSRSIRRNPSYLGASEFFSGLYRPKRAVKEYDIEDGAAQQVARDFDSIAGRTPLSLSQIIDFRTVLEWVFSHLAMYGGDCDVSGVAKPHVHVSFISESDKLLVTAWMHKAAPNPNFPNLQQHAGTSDFVTRGMVDYLDAEQWKGDIVVRMTKRFGPAIGIPSAPDSTT